MRLNDLHPGAGSKRTRKRVGRGAGSGLGKTSGRGQKGQKSRSGGRVARGFEGGQMPLQRRLPKFGFTSRKALFNAEVQIRRLNDMDTTEIDAAALKAAGLVSRRAQRIKIIAGGDLTRALKVSGIAVTKGARTAIEAAGGQVSEAPTE